MADTIPRLGVIVTAALAACSTLPDTSFPPQREFDVVVTYRLAPGGRVEVPMSGSGLTILELATEPEVVERIDDEDRRFFEPALPADELRVFCRGRVDGERRGEGVWFRPLQDLFPGAAAVESRGQR